MAVMYEDLGDIDSAIQEYKKALSGDYNNALIHLNLASSFIRENNFDKAIKELNLAAKFDPESVEPHAILALIYSSQNQLNLATLEYEIALKNASKIQPKNVSIYKNLGAVYIQQKKIKEAQKTYQLIIELAPQDAEAHFYLANIHDELKERPKAVEELKKALQIRPDYPEALNYLGYVCVEEGRDLDQAEIMIKKALAAEPDNGAYTDSLGWLYYKRGLLEDALKELEKASRLMEDPVIYEHLGYVYIKTGQPDKARESWEKSLKIDPAQEHLKRELEKLNKENTQAIKHEKNK